MDYFLSKKYSCSFLQNTQNLILRIKLRYNRIFVVFFQQRCSLCSVANSANLGEMPRAKAVRQGRYQQAQKFDNVDFHSLHTCLTSFPVNIRLFKDCLFPLNSLSVYFTRQRRSSYREYFFFTIKKFINRNGECCLALAVSSSFALKIGRIHKLLNSHEKLRHFF